MGSLNIRHVQDLGVLAVAMLVPQEELIMRHVTRHI
jgi:hypothetical protein